MTERCNPDKPHRCPRCHTVTVHYPARVRWWRRYRCCQCRTVFTRWLLLARLLPLHECNAPSHKEAESTS